MNSFRILKASQRRIVTASLTLGSIAFANQFSSSNDEEKKCCTKSTGTCHHASKSCPSTSTTSSSSCCHRHQSLKNSAFVFIKPHANTQATQEIVSAVLTANQIRIVQEGELTSDEIDKGMLIDQHYYAIASKATLVKPKDLPVPKELFEKSFGLSYEQALHQNLVFNALDACQYLNINATQLDQLWAKAKKVKFGGGFYCGILDVSSITGQSNHFIYVFNGFFMAMRSKFVEPGKSIHYYVVQFDSNQLHWNDFRGKILGPTDPKDALQTSLRGRILTNWKQLGLSYPPNVGDNGVHASASPFEGLAERMNWLKIEPENDEFGKAMICHGISKEIIRQWSIDPQIKGKSLFDQLEDLDANECLKKSCELAK